MTEETPQAQQIPEHSHDEMYLVYHHRGRVPGETDYLSCHHCGFIKVPKLADLTAQLAEEKAKSSRLEGEVKEWKDRFDRHEKEWK